MLCRPVRIMFCIGLCSTNVNCVATGNIPQREQLRRGKSLLGREEDVHESGLALFKRATTKRRKKVAAPEAEAKRSCLDNLGPGPKGPWFVYCYVITFLVPSPLLRLCGKSTYKRPLIHAHG